MKQTLWRASMPVAVVAALTAGAIGCGSSTPGAVTTTTTTSARPAGSGSPGTVTPETGTVRSAAPNRKLRVMVTDDDGVRAPGIDALVEAIRKEPDVEVHVVAPEANQSGTGGKTTDGQLSVVDATTLSGFPAKAVKGYPADTVIWALGGGLATRPDVVLSGNNTGQNLGPFVDISGTVGAARAAVQRGIPAIAVSQGLGDPLETTDYASGVGAVIDWFRAHRGEYLQPPSTSGGELRVVSFNVPTCATGSVGEVVEAPVAAEIGDRDITTPDCTSTDTSFTDDIDAFLNGHAVVSFVGARPEG